MIDLSRKEIKKKNKPEGAVLILRFVTANPKSQITARISSCLFVCPLSIKIYFKVYKTQYRLHVEFKAKNKK